MGHAGTSTLFADLDDVWHSDASCPLCFGRFAPEPPVGEVRCECGAELRVERKAGWWRIRPIALDDTIEGTVDEEAVVRGLGPFLAERTGWR